MNSVYEFIKTEEQAFKTKQVPLASNWNWNMHEHIRRSFLLKHSKFSDGANDDTRPNQNIVKPILNIAYRTEGFDVSDIHPFVNDFRQHYKSFIFRKFHPKWARKNDIDTFIDDLVESYVDYGLALVKNVNNARPEVVPLQRIAFCDQTNVLSGPICERHEMSPEELLEFKGKWNDDKIEEALIMAEAERQNTQDTLSASTPGKFIEVYELRGMLPKGWLNDSDDEELVRQVQIIAFYKDKEENRHGIKLFSSQDRKERYKALKRDPLYSRACGFGGVEELFEPQMWTNYSMIHLKKMMDAAAVMIGLTDDPQFTQQKLTDMDTAEIKHIKSNLQSFQFNPGNKEFFEESIDRWQTQAQIMGSANEALQGENPSSGTPFKLQNLVVQEAKGNHIYRQGKISTFVAEIYRDWVMDYLRKEYNKGEKFMADFTLEELGQIADRLITKRSNSRLKKLVFEEGKQVTEEERQFFKQIKKLEFMKKGQKHFLEAVKDELKKLPIDVEVNIKGKQADLAQRADKLTNIFREIIGNPEILRNPGMSKLFNQILEASGFSPLEFSDLTMQLPREQGSIESPVPQQEQEQIKRNNQEARSTSQSNQ